MGTKTSETRTLTKNEFQKYLTSIATVAGKEINTIVIDAYYEKAQHIPANKLVANMASYIANLRFPTIDELTISAGIKISEAKNSHFKRTGPDWQSPWEQLNFESVKDDESLTIRICLQHPNCTSLDKTVEHWNSAINFIRNCGFEIYHWSEYTGKAEFELETTGRKVTQNEEFYYAMAGICRPKKYANGFVPKEEISKSNDFAGKILANI